MNRRSLIIFALLLAFWLIISAEIDFQHILAGVILVVIVMWFWRDLSPRMPRLLAVRELPRLGYFLILLAGYTIQSSIDVAKTLLFSKPPARPVLMVMEPPVKSNWGRVLLANCITFTPGSLTIDVDPETGKFLVHALTEEIAHGLVRWRIISEIEKFEERM